MRNRFGVLLYRDDVRWAAAEGVSETVIAAVLLLHDRSVEQIVAELTAVELEQVIKLVARSPRVYPPGVNGPRNLLTLGRAIFPTRRGRRSAV